MPSCSLCGSQHDTESAVVQHIFMSSSGEHGEWPGKSEIWKNSGKLVNDNDPGGSSDNGGSGGGEDPTMGSDEGSSSSSSFETPCGHETVDTSDIPEGSIVDGETIWTCGECGESWRVQV
jgi:hypothetical protein